MIFFLGLLTHIIIYVESGGGGGYRYFLLLVALSIIYYLLLAAIDRQISILSTVSIHKLIQLQMLPKKVRELHYFVTDFFVFSISFIQFGHCTLCII